ncbi:MAG: SEC-C metal-binding domain-containing protein, partial [Solirubrobacteraceae bacterium]
SVEAKVAEEHEEVLEAGDLFIIGTERHESRRIDNQLRGRAGRQGDPGESRFFLSGQDDLVRLFAGDRIYNILERFGTTDDEGHEEPIEAGILSKQIEKAQRKVEEQNFLIRKRVLEYDDVMNEQRRIVYEYRDQILEGRDMADQAREEIGNVIDRLVDEYLIGDYVEDWDLEGMAIALADVYPVDFDAVDAEQMDRNELVDSLAEQAVTLYDQREQELGPELMRMLERYLLLQIIDNRWREHLYDMDYLREGIHLRGFAQIEPIIAYKNEAYTLFTDLMNTIWADFSRMIYHVEVEVEGDGGAAVPPPSRSAGGSSTRSANVTYSGGVGAPQPSALAAAAAGTGVGVAPEGYANAEGYADAEPIPVVEQRRVDEHDQVGRNDPCWCGSGKKFKKCHGT